jgi:hypothetical protein
MSSWCIPTLGLTWCAERVRLSMFFLGQRSCVPACQIYIVVLLQSAFHSSHLEVTQTAVTQLKVQCSISLSLLLSCVDCCPIGSRVIALPASEFPIHHHNITSITYSITKKHHDMSYLIITNQIYPNPIYMHLSAAKCMMLAHSRESHRSHLGGKLINLLNTTNTDS